jgi:hypothetical protein
VVRAEDAALVRSALSLLSPLQRAALVKREVEDKTLPVIAGELDIPEDNVKHLLFRARRALRKRLAGSSLAPGGDADARGLGLSAKAGSRGLAALLVLLVLGLGSGPDLEAIPVVGRDLPDVIGVTEMAETLRGVVSGVGERIAPSGGAGTSSVGAGRLESALLALSAPLADRAAEAAAESDRGLAAAGQSAGAAGLIGAVLPRAGSALAGWSPQASPPGSSAGPSSSTTAADRAGVAPDVGAGVAPHVGADVPRASDRPAPGVTAPAPAAGSAAPGGPQAGTGAGGARPGPTPPSSPAAGNRPDGAVVPPAAARPAAPAETPAARADRAAAKAAVHAERAAAKADKEAAKADKAKAEKADKAKADKAAAARAAPPAAPPPTPTAVLTPPAPAVAEPAPAGGSEPGAVQPGESATSTP